MIAAHALPAKSRFLPAFAAAILSAVLSATPGMAQEGPPAPPILTFDSYSFYETNLVSDYGSEPIGESNAFIIPEWGGEALLVDTTNEIPAYVNCNIVESNGYMNLDLQAGAVFAFVIPDWASADTNQLGQGPGELGYILAAGDWSSGSPGGLWSIYVDAGGTNIYFGGVSNSTSITYVSAPISWASNSIHMLGLYYDTDVSKLFLDGQLVGTGGPVTITPSTNTWTNGFYIGSDNLGYEQFRGIYPYLELDTTNVLVFEPNCFTNDWAWSSNTYYAWLDSSDSSDASGGSENSMLSALSSASIRIADITGSAVYTTNMSSTVVQGQGVTFTFAIEGGSNGVPYDVFSTTNLVGPRLTNSVWTWLGQGTNGGMYQVTNQTSANLFFVLGTPQLAPDGSGETVAYEALIPHWRDGGQTNTPDDDIIVYGAPLATSGYNEACPGAYTGYISYKLAPPVWGWAPSTNTTVYTASDTNRTDTQVEYVGAYGDEGCGQTTVTIPYPAISPAYRFSIYFTNNVPLTNYPITLRGLTPY